MTVSSKLLLISLLTTTAISSAAIAQNAAPESQDETAQPAAEVETVIVTARKSNESLTSVPLSISALTAAAIEKRGITDILQVAQFTPGFRFQNQSVGRNDRGFKQYVIRGMVPNSALATRQSVTLFVDGAPVSGGNISGVTDITRIETIRGPQSAFFGRSTFAGAINFVTRPPSNDWGANIAVSRESYNTTDATASIEGPIISDKLAFRLSGRSYSTDGAYSNIGWPGEKLGARQTQSLSLSLKADPTEDLSIRMFATAWNDSDGPPANALYGVSSQNCTLPGTGTPLRFVCGKLSDPPKFGRIWSAEINPIAYTAVQTGSTLYGANFVDHLGLEREAAQFRLMADWDIGDFTVSGIAAYSKNKWGFLQSGFGVDTRNVPNPNYNATTRPIPYIYSLTLGNTQDEDKYLELRVASPKDRKLRATLGTNYYQGETNNLTAGYNSGTGYALFTPRTVNKSDTYAVFGSVEWTFAEHFTGSFEGRYQIDKLFQKTYSGTFPEYEKEYKSFSPRLILRYEPKADQNLYVSYSEGNRPGEFNTIYRTLNAAAQAQVNALISVDEAVPEDKVKMGEVGYKSVMLDRRLRVSASAYYGEWTNRHVPNVIFYYNSVLADGVTGAPGEPLRNVQLTAANGEVKLKGFELESTFRVNTSLTIEGTWNMADTEIVNTSCTDCISLLGISNPKGNQLPFYPKYAATLSANYERDMGNDVLGFARADAIYSGRQYESEANLTYIPASVTLNLRIGADFEKYRVELYGRNVFDNKTPTSLSRGAQTIYNANGSTASTANGITVSLPEPAVYGARFSARF